MAFSSLLVFWNAISSSISSLGSILCFSPAGGKAHLLGVVAIVFCGMVQQASFSPSTRSCCGVQSFAPGIWCCRRHCRMPDGGASHLVGLCPHLPPQLRLWGHEPAIGYCRRASFSCCCCCRPEQWPRIGLAILACLRVR
jgi:hypothetical protein